MKYSQSDVSRALLYLDRFMKRLVTSNEYHETPDEQPVNSIPIVSVVALLYIVDLTGHDHCQRKKTRLCHFKPTSVMRELYCGEGITRLGDRFLFRNLRNRVVSGGTVIDPRPSSILDRRATSQWTAQCLSRAELED